MRLTSMAVAVEGFGRDVWLLKRAGQCKVGHPNGLLGGAAMSCRFFDRQKVKIKVDSVVSIGSVEIVAVDVVITEAG